MLTGEVFVREGNRRGSENGACGGAAWMSVFGALDRGSRAIILQEAES